MAVTSKVARRQNPRHALVHFHGACTKEIIDLIVCDEKITSYPNTLESVPVDILNQFPYATHDRKKKREIDRGRESM